MVYHLRLPEKQDNPIAPGSTSLGKAFLEYFPAQVGFIFTPAYFLRRARSVFSP
jgi:hypothetical protein